MKTELHKKLMNRTLVLLTFCCLIFFGNNLNAQSADLDQVRNGTVLSPVSPGDWVNGNAGAQNSHYVEGMSIPYRCVMEDLPPADENNPHWIIIEWDIRSSAPGGNSPGKNAFDFLTVYDNLEPHYIFGHGGAEVIDPLIVVTGNGPSINTLKFPRPNSTGGDVEGQPGDTWDELSDEMLSMTIFGGTITSMEYELQGDLSANNASSSLKIFFYPEDGYSTAVLAWGGRIATQDTWGEGNSAVFISGSPYHMRLEDWNLGNLGNQDLSCNAAAISDIPKCDFVTDTYHFCDEDVPEEMRFDIEFPSDNYSYEWLLPNDEFGNNNTGAIFTSGVNMDYVTVDPLTNSD
ncbi:MAG: hypothetical protein C0591_04490, partial [Marinilabiliales bacterium]